MLIAKVLYLQKKNDLINILLYTNVFSDSMITIAPSRLFNYGNSPRETCNGANNVEPYDARCRSWYKKSYQTDQLILSAPLLFQSTFLIGVIATQRVNDDDGEYLTTINQSVGFEQLINKIFMKQDKYSESDPQEGYTVMINNINQTIYHHRYWKPQDKTLRTWMSMEYNSTTYFTEGQKQSFSDNINSITNYSLNGNYSILDRINTNNFFFKFERNNNTYLSVLYPVMIDSITKYKNKVKINTFKPMLVGRVQKDRTTIFEEITLKFIPFYKILIDCEISVVIIWLILNLLHYTAYLYNSTDQQIIYLIQAIKNNTTKMGNNLQSKLPYQSSIFYKLKDLFRQSMQNQESISKLCNSSYKNVTQNLKNEISLNRSYLHTSKQLIHKKYLNSPNTSTEKEQQSFTFFKNKMLKDINLEMGKLKVNSHISTVAQGQNSLDESIHSSMLSSLIMIQSVSNKQEEKAIDLEDIKLNFLELKVIIESIKGIFNLLKLAKINHLKGNNDLSIIQFCQAFSVFVQVKNTYQQIKCLQQIGMQFLKQKKFIEAASIYEQALIVILQDMNLSSYKELFCSDGLKNLKSFDNKQIWQIAYLYRMISISQLQDYIKENCRNELILKKALENINLSIKLLSNRNSQENLKNLIISRYVRLEILFYIEESSYLSDSHQLQNKLIEIKSSLNTPFVSNKKQQQQIYSTLNFYSIIEQNVSVLNQKYWFQKKKYLRVTQNLTSLLEESENLDDYAKLQTLKILQKVFQQSSIQTQKVKEELWKFDYQRWSIKIIIEMDYQMSQKSIEQQLYNICKFICFLKPHDTISLIIYDTELSFICQEYQQSQDQFTFFSLKEIYRQFLENQGSHQMQINPKLTCLDAIYQVVQRQAQTLKSNPFLKLDTSTYKGNKNQENLIYILFSSGNRQDIQNLQEIDPKLVANINLIQKMYKQFYFFHHIKTTENSFENIPSNFLYNYSNSPKAWDNDFTINHQQNNLNVTTRKHTIDSKIFLSPALQHISNKRSQNISFENSYLNICEDQTSLFSIRKRNETIKLGIDLLSNYLAQKGCLYKIVGDVSQIIKELSNIRIDKPELNSIYFF